MYINKPDIIESFVSGKLTGHELSLFEAELQKDVHLQAEVALQKEIVNSIQHYRKMQLKGRMDNIVVTTTSQTMLKIAASIAAAGLITLGIFFKDDIFADTKSSFKTSNLPVPDKIAPVKSSDNQISLVENKPSVAVVSTTTSTNSAKNTEKVVSNKEKSTGKTEQVEVVVPDADFHTSNSISIKENNLALPKSDLAQSTEQGSVKTEVLIENNNQEFHYKYYGGKLFLCGDFDSPYELLDFNKADGKFLYFKYKNKFYKINDNQREKVKLAPIQDEKLINELNHLSK